MAKPGDEKIMGLLDDLGKKLGFGNPFANPLDPRKAAGKKAERLAKMPWRVDSAGQVTK